jgi:hypothetical protein
MRGDGNVKIHAEMPDLPPELEETINGQPIQD